jgi:uncharacterized protein YlzI (FlbEa/FlbD family)
MRLTDRTNGKEFYINPMKVLSIWPDGEYAYIELDSEDHVIVKESFDYVVRMHERFIKRIWK